jgi:hypothetical protein
VLAGLAGRDGSGFLLGDGASEADTAIALLTNAVDLGYGSADDFRTEAALDSLRARPDFRLLTMDLAFPAEPFSKGTETNQ